jgi:Methyltransferase domain
MERLVPEQRDLRMLRQKIVDRGGPGFLHAGDDETHAIDFAPSKKIRLHVPNCYHFYAAAKLDRPRLRHGFGRTGILRRAVSQAFIGNVQDAAHESGGFEDLAWLFTCDSRNRGLIRQGFDEAALLWKAVRSTSGNILEIGRNLAGSTVLLAAASEPEREIFSIDNRSNEQAVCKDYVARRENKARVHLLVADSRKPLPNLRFGFAFIDGDHTFEGVLADVVAHWNALQSQDETPPLAAFHDALPNDNFKWRDANRRLKRFTIRLKNKFRREQKPEVGPAYEPGVLKVCDELVRQGLAAKWGSAASMLVLRKIADLPPNFSEIARNA